MGLAVLQPLLAAVSKTSGNLSAGGNEHLLWARELQAMSLAFHIPLVCFGIAWPAMVLFTEGLWLRTRDETYRALAKRWSKVMLLLFAVGVVSGTILSFEFGILWPNFMSTFGDVFGLAFGFEGFSFFLEAIFITIYVYGWDRLPERQHFLTGIPIVITGVTGSFMVIAVNGWMNNPVGFDIVNGAVTNVQPWKALFNGYFWHEFTHMYVAGYVVAGFVVASVYAWAWLKGDRSRYVRAGLIIPLTFAALASPVQLFVGDWAGRAVAEQQPIKLAAMEGLGQTQKDAPFTLGGVYEESTNSVKGGLAIPDMLSILAYHDPSHVVEGLDAVPPQDRPGKVNVVRYSFHVMVGIGTLLALLGVFYAALWWREGRLPRSKWFYRGVVIGGPLSIVALIAGWIVTEVGRQPWIAYGVMRVEDAVTGAAGLPAMFTVALLIYTGMYAIVVWLLRKLSRQGAAR
ncbi:MAG: cytochrome ubiquinol oxidase subunit I [Solirubrobacterales bacterium]